MAKNPNTFEKRRREIEKKQRAEEKRKLRKARKDQPDKAGSSDLKRPPTIWGRARVMRRFDAASHTRP